MSSTRRYVTVHVCYRPGVHALSEMGGEDGSSWSSSSGGRSRRHLTLMCFHIQCCLLSRLLFMGVVKSVPGKKQLAGSPKQRQQRLGASRGTGDPITP